jgi:cytidylate kinase
MAPVARSYQELELLARAAEMELRREEFIRSLQAAAERQPREQVVSSQVQPYIAVSREAGVGALEVAQELGQLLNMEVLDKELLDFMASKYKLPRSLLAHLDETTANWVHDLVNRWLDRQMVSHDEYVHLLGQTVVLMACRRSAIFIGRGVQFLLPRDRGLAVRLVGPERFRIEHVMQATGMRYEEAREWVLKTDRRREEFLRTYFHHDPNDPHIYDLVVNVGRLRPPQAARVIAQAFREILATQPTSGRPSGTASGTPGAEGHH